jgi:putative glycosyltransferase (TIGR04372 family)
MKLYKYWWKYLYTFFKGVELVTFNRVRVRIVVLYGSRVGPLIITPELARISRKEEYLKNRLIIVDLFILYLRYGEQQIDNTIIKFWKNQHIFLPSGLLPAENGPEWLLENYPNLMFKQDSTDDTDVEYPLINHPPKNQISNYKTRQIKQILHNFKLTEKDKWVCLLVRDELYLNKTFPNINWKHHDYRNHDVQLFIPSITFLIRAGYKVFRMGAAAKDRVNLEHPNFIDYVFTEGKSQLTDFALWTKCSFAITTSSGIDFLASLNRRPVGIIDAVPVNHQYLSTQEVLNYKKHLNLEDNRILTKSEIIEIGLGNSYFSEEYQNKGVKLELSSPLEIMQNVRSFEKKVRENGYEIKKMNTM